MTELIPLPRLAFEVAPVPATELGRLGELAWLPVEQLFIDPKYQRAVREDGRKNVRRIVERFSWSFFSPLVVARRGENRYAVIDGQHRGIGAVTHGGIAEVPCLIIQGDERAEARAFAIINGQVTSVLPGQIFHARLAGGEPKAIEIAAVCEAAGARVLKVAGGVYRRGDTHAVGTLERCLEQYGRDTLITALQLVTETGNGNPGMLGQAIIYAGCAVLHDHPKWRDAGDALFRAIETVSIAGLLKRAKQRCVDQGGALRAHLIAVLNELFAKELGDGGTRPQTIRTGTRDASGRRFTGKPKKDPAGLNHLAADHPAIVENRTLFPSTVVDPDASQRLLVSGANSVKLGAKVLKGEWSGFPIYQLSLEERASCPPTCNNRLTCYGNAMPFARRHRHGPALVARLETELAALQASSPDGFVVRLHVLGDFYSAEYVGAWSDFLHRFPALHVFGYTAWDRKSQIGDALLRMTRAQWSRFAIRFSAERSAPQGATTIWRKPEGALVAEGVVCPAQSDATACCATCGLCWSASARDKTIVFIGHGGVGNGGRKPAQAPPQPAKAVRAPLPRVVQRDMIEATGPAKEIVAYLRRAGVDVEALPENRFRYYGSKISFDELVARANRQRLVDGLEKFKVSA